MRAVRYDLAWRREHLGVLSVLVLIACAAMGYCRLHRTVRLHEALPVDHDRAAAANLRLDPNVEPPASLRRLGGLGPVRAAAIAEHRAASSQPFTQPADLQRVAGIGPVTVERISPYLRFGSPD